MGIEKNDKGKKKIKKDSERELSPNYEHTFQSAEQTKQDFDS